jgi:hypothetical protein
MSDSGQNRRSGLLQAASVLHSTADDWTRVQLGSLGPIGGIRSRVNAGSGSGICYSMRLKRTVALIGQERTSKIMLNGVSAARRKRLKPASVAT